MPVILRPEDHEVWLRGSADDAQSAVKQHPSDLMVAYRVGLRVNSPKNDDPALIEPSDGAENSPEQTKKKAAQGDLF